MKKTIITITALLSTLTVSQASIQISGTVINDAEIFGSSQGVFISSNTGSFDESLFATLAADTSFTAGTVIGDYTVMGFGTVFPASATNGFLGGINYDLGGNIATSNEIGVLVFDSSTNSASSGDAYTIWTNDWLVASDSANAPIGAAALGAFGAGSVVPEPSTYAALAGLCALGAVMVRRRRA